MKTNFAISNDISPQENSFSPQGRMLKILTFPHPILSKVAPPVTEFTPEIATLCQDMLYTMYHSSGIGLAAPQIGKGFRIFVLDVDYRKKKIVGADGQERFVLSGFNPRIFINPVIIRCEEQAIFQEGCLSLPGLYEEVERSKKITVEYFDLTGKKHFMTAENLLAICIQHENDHLDGLVFLDRLGQLKKNLLKKKFIKQNKKQ